MIDYLGKIGCCLACTSCGNCRNPCFTCKCTKCGWYHDGDLKNIKQRCFYLDLKKSIIWFDYLDVVDSTEKAYKITDGSVTVWIPSCYVKFKEKEIGIAQWIADEKGFFSDGIFELNGKHFKEFEKEKLSNKYNTRMYDNLEVY